MLLRDRDRVADVVENIGRVMPKGEFLPLPLLCTARFGEPLKIAEGETKREFLDRAVAALLALAPVEAP